MNFMPTRKREGIRFPSTDYRSYRVESAFKRFKVSSLAAWVKSNRLHAA